jgi:Tol biopolymer transport system component
LDKERLEVQHAWPEFLPDGKRFVYLARSSDRSKSALYLASLDSPSRTHLMNTISMVEYAHGYLVYQVEGTIMALPFDENSGRITGEPMPVVENVQFNSGNGRAAFSLSPTGVLAYRNGTSLGRVTQYAWFDRTGRRLGTVGEQARYVSGRLSPNGRRLAATVSTPSGGLDLVMIDIERNVTTRFASDPADEISPVWTPDGQSVIYRTNAKGAYDLAIKAAGGATAERTLLESGVTKNPVHVSNDGATLLYEESAGVNSRLWGLPLKPEGKPFQVFPAGTDTQRNGMFSPDGKWIVYVSGPIQTANVYLQPFPPTGAREQLSTTTGYDPQWTSDGRQIMFVTADDHIMSVDITTTNGQLLVGRPRELFTQTIGSGHQFEMDAKGERFLLLVEPGATSAQAPPPDRPLTVVVNLLGTLKKR